MKKINKFFSVFLAIVMVLSALPICASAQEALMTISADKTEVKAGDTVTLSINLSENSYLNYFTIDLIYDENVLKYDSYTVNEGVINENYSENKIRLAFARVIPYTEELVVATITFKVISSACSTASISVYEAANENFENITVVTNELKIHSFGNWTTVSNSTCENAGQKSKSCTCGEKVTESISALGHNYSTEYTVDKNPTCTVNGSKSQHCFRCDSVQNVTVIPATGHSYKEEITKVPTHTENGEKTFTCYNCGDTYKEVINADGTHKYISSVTKAPTCIEKGIMTYTCACGDTYTEEIPMVAHTETSVSAVAPTCTQTGLTEGKKCSFCDAILEAQAVIPAKGHIETTVSAVAPTCTQTGLTEGKKCSACGETLTAQQEIPATGHVPNSKGNCDTCGEKICDHNCHKGGISGFFWKIANFFNKLFGSKKYCECGYAHY